MKPDDITPLLLHPIPNVTSYAALQEAILRSGANNMIRAIPVLAAAFLVLGSSFTAVGGPVSYGLNFVYGTQPTDPNSNGSWSGSFNKSISWNQSGSIGFDQSILGVNVGATVAGETIGSLGLSGTLKASDSSVAASLGGNLQVYNLSSPSAGIARVGTSYTPTYTKFETATDSVQFNSTLDLAALTGVGAKANVGSYGFSSNLNSNGSVAGPNLGVFTAGTPVLTYNQNGNGKVSVFGSPSFSLPGNGLVPVPTGFTGFSAKVDVNPSLTTSAYSSGSRTAASSASLPTAAQFSFATSAADLISPLPFAPELTGTLGSLIPDPKSSNPIKELAYEAVEAVLGNIGYDALETTLKLKIGYQTSYSLDPSQTLNYTLHVAQTGQNVSGNTNIGYADLNTDGLSRLTVDPIVSLVNPVFTEKSFLTITPEIDLQALSLDGFGKQLGPLVNEDYSPQTFMIALPTATGSIQLAGLEEVGLRPFEIDVPSASAPTPEPATVLLLGTGLVIAGLAARHRR